METSHENPELYHGIFKFWEPRHINSKAEAAADRAQSTSAFQQDGTKTISATPTAPFQSSPEKVYFTAFFCNSSAM